MSFLAGKIVLDVVAGAPNNGEGEDNIGKVKKLRVGREEFPYVSAQAVRRWLRDSLPHDEPRSGVTRSGTGKKQQAYTEGRPDRYLDDDLFGYMVAVKNDSYQRDTVLATGTFVSLTPQRATADYGTMSRDFPLGEHPVLHQHELYSAVLAADVLLDLPRVGVFETDGSGLRVALSPAAAEEAQANGAEPVTLRGTSALRLAQAERRRRVAVVLNTLAKLRGGAKQALHYGDRTPAFVLLAPMKGGVNPFTRVVGARDGKPAFQPSVLREELSAWADELDGQVLLGWAPGFLGDQRDHAERELKDLIEDGTVSIQHPRVMLTGLAAQIEQGIHDDWFEDPSA
ncbi:type I-B CRISPR-associated protein Cas7/Cst2/DevR [Actinoallomurus rhizosphaericola]|uniref:type I-B CRISPR-associated protein Cas7/Cst2/DevR n=1 Tax=Actinoallomurus rhizosphaericola TaxID=2952536 RepID=UPI002093506A|nr:type I-B CRISPR-associated protein Cas7/Cst2/DevR [Actinoallomurus rhizosphaericola]MCO5996663.1 type I-B CRISPR-associated protein Cas7/Cst2/DevR [Actinoallomurus rhizosphaericola]